MNITENDFESNSNTSYPVGAKITVIPTFVKSNDGNKNNLASSNSYYKVNKEFSAQIRIGSEIETNTYYGGTKLIGTIYEVIIVPVDSEIHNLHGGLFLIMNGTSHELRNRTFDLNILDEIPYSSTTKVHSYRTQISTKESE